MRWVNIKNGIKQRLNEILGTSDGAGTDPLTYWSIQAAMLENLRRIVKALIGNSTDGRPMKGCWIYVGDSKTINITPGYACTPNGDIVVLQNSVSNFDIGTTYPSTTVKIYLKHTNSEITQTANPTIGKSTGLIGQSGSHEIINDDSGVSSGIGASDIVKFFDNSGPSTDVGDHVFLGEVITDSSGEFTDDEITNTPNRGLSPNGQTGQNEFLIPNLKVGSSIAGDAEFYNVVVNGVMSVAGAATFSSTSSFAGAATFNGAASFASTSTFTGAATFNGAVLCALTSTFTGLATFNGAASFASTSTFAGLATFNGAVLCALTSTFTGLATFNGAALFNSTSQFVGNAAFGGVVSIYDELDLDTHAGILSLHEGDGAVKMAGVSVLNWFTGPVASITIRNGIVIAAS